ncbi:Cthe_2314 family HEPN domain-containing protein [Pontibacter toksunensis]|uniref:Cthe_2314 family HEPN domain-containing protein n=1 Tax=Pontibacter toksunensis TaxID=1332631 RepID=A0ABW6BZY3_9BACT
MNITLKAIDFKYPTKEEKVEACKNYPEIKRFGFPEVNAFASLNDIIDSDAIGFDDKVRRNNLHYWDVCIENKLFNLFNAYINSVTHYNRGIPNKLENLEANQPINYVLFNFYLESFYSLFFSVGDVVAQLINVYYSLGFKERSLKRGDNAVSFHKVKTNMVHLNQNLYKILDDFGVATRKASNFRHNLTHAFPNNQSNHLISTTVNTNDGKIYGFHGGVATAPSEFMDNINESLEQLSVLMKDLRKEFNLD